MRLYRLIPTLAALAVAGLSLAGCTAAEQERLDASVAKARARALVVSCKIARGASLAERVQGAVDLGQAVRTGTGAVLVASKGACVALGGDPVPNLARLRK